MPNTSDPVYTGTGINVPGLLIFICQMSSVIFTTNVSEWNWKEERVVTNNLKNDFDNNHNHLLASSRTCIWIKWSV